MTTNFDFIYHSDANKDSLDIYLNDEVFENESEIDDILSSCSSPSIYDGYREESLSRRATSDHDNDFFPYDQDDPLINGENYHHDDMIASILKASSSDSLYSSQGYLTDSLDFIDSEAQKTNTNFLKNLLEGKDLDLPRNQIFYFKEAPLTSSGGNSEEEMDGIQHRNQDDHTAETKPQIDQFDKVNQSSDLSSDIPQQKAKRKKRKYERRASARKNIQLYQFVLRLLDDEDDCVAWVSREEGIFRLLKSKAIAEMWGKYKKNDNMTYESLSRALRHYYSQDILVPVPKKLHYKFCRKTLEDWYKARESN